jgi:YggT family protein
VNPLSQIGILVIQTLGGLYALIVMLRFMLQVSRADFYNPLSQFIVKATNPLLLPMRRVIPGVFGIDFAGLLLAFGVEFVTIFLSTLLVVGMVNPLMLLAWTVLGMASMMIYVFFVCMIAMIILSFVAPYTRHPAALLATQLVRPVCAPFQRLIPAVGGFDISPIFVFLLLNVARILIESAANSTGAGGAIRQLIPGLF